MSTGVFIPPFIIFGSCTDITLKMETKKNLKLGKQRTYIFLIKREYKIVLTSETIKTKFIGYSNIDPFPVINQQSFLFLNHAETKN